MPFTIRYPVARRLGPATLTLVLSLALLVTGLALPARAEPSAVKVVRQMEDKSRDFDTAVHILEKFVVRNDDGTFALNMSAAKAGVGHGIFSEIVRGMEETNRLVREGLLSTTADLQVYAAEGAFTPQSTYSAWYWRWWGVEVHISAYWTNKLINALAGGASIAGIVAIYCAATGVCGVVAGVAAGLLALGAAVIGFCSNSRGVVLKRTYTGQFWCHGH